MDKPTIDKLISGFSLEEKEKQLEKLDEAISKKNGLSLSDHEERYFFFKLLTDKTLLNGNVAGLKSLPTECRSSLLTLLNQEPDIRDNQYYFSRIATAVFGGLIENETFEAFCEEVQNHFFKPLSGAPNLVLIGSPFVHDEAAAGLYRIGSFLSLFGINVHIVDNPQSEKLQTDLPFYPHIIGKRFLTATFQDDIDILNKFEDTYPDSIYIAGGQEASVEGRVFTMTPRIDASVMSWGEFTLLDMIMSLSVSGKTIIKDQERKLFHGIEGLRTKDSEIKRKKPFGEMDFRVITQAFNPRLIKDCGGPVNVVNVHATSHCTQKCIFCMAGTVITQSLECKQKVLHIKPEDFLVVIKRIRRYLPKTQVINFTDDNFLVNQKLVEDFLDLIEQHELQKSFSFFIEARLDALDNTSEDTLERMAKLNFSRIIIGLESPSAKIAKDLGKGESLVKRMPHYREILLKAKKSGIPCISVFIILHTLHETVEDLFETLRTVIDLMVDDRITTVITAGLSIYPETPLWNMLSRKEISSNYLIIYARGPEGRSMMIPSMALPVDGESRQLLEYSIVQGYNLDHNFLESSRVYTEMLEEVRQKVTDLSLLVEMESSILSFFRIHAALFSVSKLLLSRKNEALTILDYMQKRRDQWFYKCILTSFE